MAFFISVQEAATLLGVSTTRVYQLIKLNKISAERVGKQWVIDYASVRERIDNKPSPGRPEASANLSLSEYTLMNRDYEVLEFSYAPEENKFWQIQKIIDENRAPLGLVLSRSKKDSIRSLANWWRHRSIPISRDNIDAKLFELGLDRPDQIPFSSLGLSLSDQYWIRPAGLDVEWESINFFNNDFPDMKVKATLANSDWLKDVGLNSPDNTSDGQLSKRWIRNGHTSTLLKGGSALDQEPYNEVVASALFARLLNKDEYVPYKFIQTDRGAISACSNFLNDDEEFIPAYYVCQIKKKPNHFSDYLHYIDCCVELGINNPQAPLDKMLVCDDIIANFDRHWRNFGVIRNVETLECKSAPIFDSGSSLWCNKSEAALLKGDHSFQTKPFYEDANRQLRLVDDLSWFDPSALDGFVEEAQSILSENPALDKRLDAICEGILLRIDRIVRNI